MLRESMMSIYVPVYGLKVFDRGEKEWFVFSQPAANPTLNSVDVLQRACLFVIHSNALAGENRCFFAEGATTGTGMKLKHRLADIIL